MSDFYDPEVERQRDEDDRFRKAVPFPGEKDDLRRQITALQSRLAAAEAECRAREEVQARLIRERNAAEAEAEAERAAGLLRRARRLLHEPSMFGREKLDACVERIDAHLASRTEGEVRRG